MKVTKTRSSSFPIGGVLKTDIGVSLDKTKSLVGILQSSNCGARDLTRNHGWTDLEMGRGLSRRPLKCSDHGPELGALGVGDWEVRLCVAAWVDGDRFDLTQVVLVAVAISGNLVTFAPRNSNSC